MQSGAIFDARKKQKDCEDIGNKSSVHISQSPEHHPIRELSWSTNIDHRRNF